MTVAERAVEHLHENPQKEAFLFLKNPPAVIFVLDDFRGIKPGQKSASNANRMLQAAQASLIYHSESYILKKPQVVVFEREYPEGEHPAKTVSSYLDFEQVKHNTGLARIVPKDMVMTVMQIRALMHGQRMNGPIAVILPEDQKTRFQGIWNISFKRDDKPPVLHLQTFNSPVYEYMYPNPSESTIFNNAKYAIGIIRKIYGSTANDESKEVIGGRYTSLKRRTTRMLMNGLIPVPYPIRLMRVLRHRNKYNQ